jgi:MFS family permease
MSALLAPFLGIIVDRIGRRGKLIILNTLFFFITHLLFCVLPNYDSFNPITIIPLLLLGISMGLYCSVVMPSVPLVIEKKIIGTALGLVGVFQVKKKKI